MSASKKRVLLSQVALACSMALATQTVMAAVDVSGTTYETFTHDPSINGHIAYQGYVDWNNSGDLSYNNGNIYPVINNAQINGVISTYYLDDNTSNNNSLSITNSTVHGMITSQCLTTDCGNTTLDYYPDTLNLTVDNSTIDDAYEHYNYDVTDSNGVRDHDTIDTYDLGTAITLNQESNIVIKNNSHVAGITLTQGYEWEDTTTNSPETFDNTITVNDSVVTSGAWTELDTEGWYGQSDKPSDYGTRGRANYSPADDVALAVIANSNADNAMKTNATFNNSTLNGDVAFVSSFDEHFYANGYDSNGDGTLDTNGWDNTDELNLKLDNGSKWVGAAVSSVDSTATLYDYQPNSRIPGSVYNTDNGHLTGDEVYQSGLFNIALDNGSEWDTTKSSNVDLITVNNGSQINVADSSLLADSITLTNGSSLKISAHGGVASDDLNVNNSRVTLTEETADLYANTITVSNGGELNIGAGQVDTHNMVLTDGGALDVGSREYVLNSDLNNGRYVTNDIHQPEYDYGVVALNSDGHLAVNGDVNGNYRVRIDNATGEGSVADYKGKEMIRVYDDNAQTQATFTAANRADLGAYQYEAKQEGDSVVLRQRGLTDYANMALSIPSANTNTWNLEQDTLANRLAAARHTAGDTGGAWVTYFGGNYDVDSGALNYDQDTNGIMIGVDQLIKGNNADVVLGMAAGFAKGDISHNSGSVDQDSQSARIYSSAKFANNVFLDSSLSYSHFSNDIEADMSNGKHVTGNTSNTGWGFGVKLGYDWAFNQQGYLTPYAAISGLFQDGDDYTMSNGMSVGDQSYDSMRYELGMDVGYTFQYASDQSFRPYMKLAYVYDDASSNDAKVNGDRIDNGTDGSAGRVGIGGQFNFTKNLSTYADANYLGGGDAEQPWAANVGVKYSW